MVLGLTLRTYGSILRNRFCRLLGCRNWSDCAVSRFEDPTLCDILLCGYIIRFILSNLSHFLLKLRRDSRCYHLVFEKVVFVKLWRTLVKFAHYLVTKCYLFQKSLKLRKNFVILFYCSRCIYCIPRLLRKLRAFLVKIFFTPLKNSNIFNMLVFQVKPVCTFRHVLQPLIPDTLICWVGLCSYTEIIVCKTFLDFYVCILSNSEFRWKTFC